VKPTIWERISRARWNALRHPFYVRSTAGELTGEELARYSGQYRHAVVAVAQVSEAAADAAPPRAELRAHAVEEREHVGLWDDFVVAGGAAQTRELLAELAEGPDEDRLAAAAERAYRANWRPLDGI